MIDLDLLDGSERFYTEKDQVIGDLREDNDRLRTLMRRIREEMIAAVEAIEDDDIETAQDILSEIILECEEA